MRLLLRGYTQNAFLWGLILHPEVSLILFNGLEDTGDLREHRGGHTGRPRRPENLQREEHVLNLIEEDPASDCRSGRKNVDFSLFVRHRRSYGEQHRKSKETLLGIGNAVKSAAQGGKSAVFITENCTVVVAQIGGTATLPCVVRKFSNGVVSWIRKHDYHLLTVGVATYNTDDRFMVEHVRHLQNWGLLIKHVQPSDAGLYECQVSTHPPTSILVELKVTKAQADIQGAPDLYIRAGSMLRLVCTLKHSTEPPAFVFWYHEQRMINYDPGVIITEGRSSSILHIQDADKSHNGNYTCSPSNAVPASINVHVLNATAEEKPAAMQHANSTRSSSSSFLVHCSLLIVIMISILTTTS